MSDYTFDVVAFRLAYPAFADPTKFPDDTLQAFWNAATCYISDTNYGALSGACRGNALNLMTAHLTALSIIIAAGKIPKLVQSSGIDKVNISLTPPPVITQFQWWLSLTPYGQQLLALLQVASVGGFFVGGSLERSAFRKAGGFF